MYTRIRQKGRNTNSFPRAESLCLLRRSTSFFTGDGNTNRCERLRQMHGKKCGVKPLKWMAAETLEDEGIESGKSCVQSLLAELKRCSSTGNLARGKQLHADAVRRGKDSGVYIANALIHMYARCGSMVDARRLFDRIDPPGVVSWNAIIFGYADDGEGRTALNLFRRMLSQGCMPDSRTFVAALKACTSLAVTSQGTSGLTKYREVGKQIHLLASEIGHDCVYVQNALIDMYAKCRYMVEAKRVFDNTNNPDVVSWTALIVGYVENGQGDTALDLLMEMRSQGCAPNSITIVAALKACSILACRQRGKQIHLLASSIGCDSVTSVQNALIDMYGKCGSMVDAQKVFNTVEHPNVVSWTALISGYAENREGHAALQLLTRMRRQGCAPNAVTLVAALKACSSLTLDEDSSGREACKAFGKYIHSLILNNDCDVDYYVQNSLIDMYAKCGSLVAARKVFEGMEHPDVVSWTALISGYAANGDGATALDLFTRMKSQGCAPNALTFSSALKACGMLAALDCGRKIHAEIDASVEHDVILVNSLVDFYAKCGSLVEAERVFHSCSRTRDLTTWSLLMAGHSRLGNTKAVFSLFEGMQDAGFQPDGGTLTCILTCCSHAGLIGKGKEIFAAMSTKYGLDATVEHYNCILDIFGRSNKLDDALALLQSMPCNPNVVTWMIVLDACYKWRNAEIGRLAFTSVVSLDETNAAAYVLMAHIYESRGMWEEQETVLEMKSKVKRPAQT